MKVMLIDAAGQQVGPVEQDRFSLSDGEWRQRLSAEQYAITRRHATERAFCGTLLDNRRDGVYTCVCCKLPLFASAAKFDSGTGWPSFYRPFAEENIATRTDLAWGMVRTEILCVRCDAHLGHVFDDGPAPTGLRYCLNGAALHFVDAADLGTLAERA